MAKASKQQTSSSDEAMSNDSSSSKEERVNEQISEDDEEELEAVARSAESDDDEAADAGDENEHNADKDDADEYPFPLHAVCGSVWKNIDGQLAFLKYVVSAPPEVFTFANFGRQLAYIDALHGLKLQAGHPYNAFPLSHILRIDEGSSNCFNGADL